MRLSTGINRPIGQFVTSIGHQFPNRRLFALMLLSSLVVSLAGCFSSTARQNQELLEADLRGQERHIQELKAELDRKEGVIHSLDYEVERMQQKALGGKQPGEPVAPGVVKDIALGRLTGGYRKNARLNFDDSLQVVLEPRDSDGHAIKVPGSVHIDVFEITPQGLKTPLSSWDISQRELRQLWDQPLLGGPSYRIILPWKAVPTTEKLRVIARFTTLDGKLFEAERDVTIQLPMGMPRPGLPVGVPGGYSVVTPNKSTRTPASVTESPSAMQALQTPPPAMATRPDGSAPFAAERLPAPPVLETKTSPNPGTVPVIPFPPREMPSSPAAQVIQPEKKPQQSSENTSVPPLPAPPEVPTFDEKKPALSTGLESLPTPRNTPDSTDPLKPGMNQPQPQAQPQSGQPLTAPPPQSWRDRHQPIIQVQQSEQTGIKLSRPIPKSQIIE